MKIPITILETPRLRLRPVCLTDAPRIQALFPRWEIVQYMATAIPWPYPADGAVRFLQTVLPKMESGQEYDWAITLKSRGDDQLVGLISLYPESGQDNRGFWLAHEYHCQGLMTEAAAAVNAFAFEQLDMTELRLNNAEPNTASHRIKERSGARIVAIDEDVVFVGGTFRRVRWCLTRAAWEVHRC